MRVVAVVFGSAVVALGCERKAAPPDPAPAVATSAPVSAGPQVPSVALPRAASPAEQSASVATFEKDALDECTDFAITYQPPKGAPPDWKPSVDLAANMRKKGVTVLRKPCAEQFADRVVLATCAASSTTTADGGASAEMALVSRYYNFATVVRSDTYMKQCIEEGGNWQAIPRDSPEFVRAKHEDTMRQVERSGGLK